MTGERFVDVDGVRTCYFDKGSDEVSVLSHGSHLVTNDACESARDWELNFDRLAEWFRVVAVDKLGQGHTDNPKRDEDYTTARTVRHAYRFLQTPASKDVHAICHSPGAFVVGRLGL